MLKSALQYDWELPIYQHLLFRPAEEHTLIRYDARGNGLSDWDVHEISLDAWVSDMETVRMPLDSVVFHSWGYRKVAPWRLLMPSAIRNGSRI
jgi:pimeloyl-ACP methyl ester carboxylesterase